MIDHFFNLGLQFVPGQLFGKVSPDNLDLFSFRLGEVFPVLFLVDIQGVLTLFDQFLQDLQFCTIIDFVVGATGLFQQYGGFDGADAAQGGLVFGLHGFFEVLRYAFFKAHNYSFLFFSFPKSISRQ